MLKEPVTIVREDAIDADKHFACNIQARMKDGDRELSISSNSVRYAKMFGSEKYGIKRFGKNEMRKL